MSQDTTTSFDVLILGAGSAGYACALRAAQLGLTVGLIERDEVGGTCLHQGCVPTKAVLHAAEVADVVREAGSVGVDATLGGIDAAAVNRFKDGVVGRLHKGLSGLLRSSGVVVIRGEGRLVSSHAVDVDGVRYDGAHLVIATGSVARSLPGIEVGGPVVTSREALALTRVPRRAVVIGGSVIGVEFASAWRSLGAEVTVVEALAGLVPLEDPALGRQLERAFRRRGIDVRTGTAVTGVGRQGTDAVVTLGDGTLLEADVVLVAVGRGPSTAGLGLEEAGIRTDRGWVETTERLATSVPGVWAVGDVVRGLQLAHRGFAHGIFVAEEIAGLAPAVVVDSQIPRVTYCSPELASVGLTEPQARELHGDGVEVVEYDLAGNGRSQILETAGTVKLVALAGGPILGVHMIGARMGEQVGEAALAVGWEASAEDLALYIHAHPTQNEALGEAAMALAGRPLHAHR